MQLEWELRSEEWTDRSYTLVSDDGEIHEKFVEQPTLNELREAEQKYGERLDLWQSGLVCTKCKNVINGRFGATPTGDLLCWDCAQSAGRDETDEIMVNTDPTKAVISESQLHEKSLCDYVINVATGCRHGCEFCYVPATPAIENRDSMLNEQAGIEDPQQEWGGYLLYRDDLPERLRRELGDRNLDSEWKRTRRGRGVVMISSGTDCYQDRRSAQITRGCVQELINHDIPVRILTRSPAVIRDVDVFKQAGDLISVGSSIPSLDTELVRTIEPRAPPPRARWRALDTLQKAGIDVFVSFSPTYPQMTEAEIDTLLGHFRALGEHTVVFHEPINPRGQNFEMLQAAAKEAGRHAMAAEFERLQDSTAWTKYAVEQINQVQRRAAELYPDLEIHSWPDRLLVEETSGKLSNRLEKMRKAVSPESFGKKLPADSDAQSVLFESTTEKTMLL